LGDGRNLNGEGGFPQRRRSLRGGSQMQCAGLAQPARDIDLARGFVAEPQPHIRQSHAAGFLVAT